MQFSLPFDPLAWFHPMGLLDNLVTVTYMQVQKCCSRGQNKKSLLLTYKFQARQAIFISFGSMFVFVLSFHYYKVSECILSNRICLDAEEKVFSFPS